MGYYYMLINNIFKYTYTIGDELASHEPSFKSSQIRTAESYQTLNHKAYCKNAIIYIYIYRYIAEKGSPNS
jgi:hypothetical protein